MIAGTERRPISAATAVKLGEEFRWLTKRSIAPRQRTIREFAESEIVIPDGPHKGRKFRCETQPFTRLYFDAIDSARWNRFAVTGPSQSGKTLTAVVIPVLYHLFEIGETVICGVPHMEMAFDKWKQDFEPAIAASRYADLLPEHGRGSRGGSFTSIVFRNGSMLRFMTGGGDDKTKAGFTARVLAVTEVDGLDKASERSRESDPLKQMEARTRAYGHRKRVYLECTVSTESGRIWQEYIKGTCSRIMLPCPHCGEFVRPEREHFLGWQDAETEMKAERSASFFCPSCAAAWTDQQRESANRLALLLHGDQTIGGDGGPQGTAPETRTLGFRWSAVNNLFASSEQLGGEEWRAAREIDLDNSQKERQQFVWCEPWDGRISDIDISDQMIAARLTGLPRGVIPDDAESLVVHVDLHNRWHYWTALATSPGHVRSIVDYGLSINPNLDVNGPELAIRLGLEQLAEELTNRDWKTVSGTEHPVDLFLVDAGYQQDIGLRFVTEMGPKWRLHKGERDQYRSPKETDEDHRLGDHWYASRQPGSENSRSEKWWLFLSETNHWMRLVHGGFSVETFLEDKATRRPGSIALFGSDPKTHLTPVDRSVSRSAFATQLVSWKWEESVTAKRGQVMQWVSQFREDHWFDTTYGCLVAASLISKDALKPVDRRTFALPGRR